jgi:hypothetical protein
MAYAGRGIMNVDVFYELSCIATLPAGRRHQQRQKYFFPLKVAACPFADNVFSFLDFQLFHYCLHLG